MTLFRRNITTAILILGTLAIGAQALPSAAKKSELYLTFRSGGEDLRFHIQKQTDEAARPSLTVSFVEQRLLLPDTERPILYGRDLNDDGQTDTWFVRNAHRIEAIYTDDPRVGDLDDNADGFATASIERIVMHRMHLENRWLMGIAFRGAASFISMAISGAEQALEDHAITQLELLELQQRAVNHPSDAAMLATVDALFERGWKLNTDRLNQLASGNDYLKSGLIDLGATFAGIKFFKWLGRTGEWAVVKASATPLGRKAATYLPRLPKKVPAATGAVAGKAAPVAALTFQALTYDLMKIEVRHLLGKLTVENRVAREVVKVVALKAATLGKVGVVQVFNVYEAGAREWKYFLATQLTQILAESIARHDVKFDPNPIVMGAEFARNTAGLFTNKDFLQNFFYMSNETLLLTGISARDSNVKRRMIVCGVVSTVNSSAMNVLVKGNPDPKRLGLDAGWETIVGNVQVQVDRAAIQHFEQMAIRKGNPKIKLLGYVVTLVDQFAGYVGYAKATSAVERYSVQLIPVVAEAP